MKSPSEETSSSISMSYASQTAQMLKEYGAQVAALERERCAMLLEQLRDGTEDQVQKDLFNDAATAIRRSPYVRL
jgi:hypothetical protein